MLLPCLQAVLNEVPPTLRGPDKVPPAVRTNALSQDRFPAGVPGPAAAWAASRCAASDASRRAVNLGPTASYRGVTALLSFERQLGAE